MTMETEVNGTGLVNKVFTWPQLFIIYKKLEETESLGRRRVDPDPLLHSLKSLGFQGNRKDVKNALVALRRVRRGHSTYLSLFHNWAQEELKNTPAQGSFKLTTHINEQKYKDMKDPLSFDDLKTTFERTITLKVRVNHPDHNLTIGQRDKIYSVLDSLSGRVEKAIENLTDIPTTCTQNYI